ncbi:hypothetical protein LEN26_021010 [Aphanomyces euteiches]|nr:hypothetical protein LEN26_021010 [Aphanomyces euteiches]
MKRSLEDDLPEGWVSRMSVSKKKPYYIHLATNKTQWHRPGTEKPKNEPLAEVNAALTSAVTRAYRVGGSKRSKQNGLTLFQPWPHQVRAVCKVVAAISSQDGSTKTSNFLIQHSTGSGKSYTIACLAYQLLYTKDRTGAGFHTIIILVDRIKLDEQLGDTVESFLHQNGVDTIFRADSIEHLGTVVATPVDQKVIVTTTQKLGLLVQNQVLLARLMAKPTNGNNKTHIAIIADEVHRSHTTATRDSISIILDAMTRQTFYIGFSATPSFHTLRLFGTISDGSYCPFDCHSITQAVDAGHIVNVIDNYTSLRCTYSIKTTSTAITAQLAASPWLLMELASCHEALLSAKATSMMSHFVKLKASHVFAKCMVVARNRRDVVTYHKLVSSFMKRQALPGRVYCTFSAFDAVNEKQFNKCTLEQADVIVVCDKLDTGFNEPALMAMYLDRPLISFGRVVQLLSRLNRSRENKTFAQVVDYVNHPAHIRRAFQDFARETSLSVRDDDLTELDQDLATSSIVLWDLLPGVIFNDKQQAVEAMGDVSASDVAMKICQLDKDTYMQMKQALAVYLNAATVLRRDSPFLPRRWVEELKRLVVDDVNLKSHDETCEETCACVSARAEMKLQKIKFETAFQGSLGGDTKYDLLSRILNGEGRTKQDTNPDPKDHLDKKLNSLLSQLKK